MKSDRTEIESLKSRISITAVAERLGLSVVRGKFRCPYGKRHAHGDRTPSVSISEDKGLFRCWVCDDVRGDCFQLVQVVRGGDFKEALEWLRHEFVYGNPRQNVLLKPIAVNPYSIRPVESTDGSTPESFFREKIILSFLKQLKPVDKTPAARWLANRKIFKKTWDQARLRYIDDYDRVNRTLLSLHSLADLQQAGLYNDKGHLRYYKHPLILPYLDEAFRPHYFQARTLDKTLHPKELNLKGSVPFPYHKEALDGQPGWVYLCEGVIDTLTAWSKGFTAIGIPGVKSFKPEWLGLFRHKKVVICLDSDEAGRMGSQVLLDLFTGAGIEATCLELPEGEDVNSYFGGKK